MKSKALVIDKDEFDSIFGKLQMLVLDHLEPIERGPHHNFVVLNALAAMAAMMIVEAPAERQEEIVRWTEGAIRTTLADLRNTQ